ncbi:MAG: T9SS type A sorting domain-containing protein [Bacteroidota bacterium]
MAWLRRSVAAGTLTLSMLQGTPVALGQMAAIPAGNEFGVNTTTTNDQSAPVVAMDADGDFVVAWQSQGQDGDGFGIYAQRFAANGTPQGSEFLVNTTTTNNQSAPSVAMDDDGDFVVVWASLSPSGVYAQRYAADGTPQGGEFRVNSVTTSAGSPLVAMDADGNFAIVYGTPDGSGQGVFGQRYDSIGNALGTEFQVNTTTTDNQLATSLAMDADGDFVVLYQSGDVFVDVNVYAQRYDASGNAQGGEFQVNSFTTGNQGDPAVSMDADGDFVVAWESNVISGTSQDGSEYGVYAQRFNAAGEAQGDEFQVNTYTTSSQGNPTVAVDADGDFVIAWASSGQDDSSDSFGAGIYAQRYAADGTPQGSEFLINTTTAGNQQVPMGATDDVGDFIVVWRSTGQDGSSNGVFAQRYALTQPTVNGGTYMLPVLGSEGWRMLAQPNGTTLGTLLASVWTQGLPDADVPNGGANVLIYNEAESGAESVGFEAPASLATATPGQGFIVYLFADDDFDDGENDIDGGFPKTLSAPYTAPTGTVSPAATYTDNGTPDADGWNLLGNPFAEPLSWDAVLANAGIANIEATVYVWDPRANAYRTWNGSSGDLLGGEIAGGQGFFVKASADSPAIPFAADDTGPIDRRTYSAYSRSNSPLKLAFTLSTEVGEARTFVEAGFGGENDRDRKDGVLLSPLASSFAQLYTRPIAEDLDSAPLSINSLSLDALSSSAIPVSLPLGVAAFKAGRSVGGLMTLRWPELQLPAGWRAELHDTESGTVVNLTEAGVYTFSVTATSEAEEHRLGSLGRLESSQVVLPRIGSRGWNPVARVDAPERFEVIVTPASVVATESDRGVPETFTLDGNYPNPFARHTSLRYGLPEAATVRVAVYDVVGREVLVVQDGQQAAGWHLLDVNVGALASGVYVWRVEVQTSTGREALSSRMLIVR